MVHFSQWQRDGDRLDGEETWFVSAITELIHGHARGRGRVARCNETRETRVGLLDTSCRLPFTAASGLCNRGPMPIVGEHWEATTGLTPPLAY